VVTGYVDTVMAEHTAAAVVAGVVVLVGACIVAGTVAEAGVSTVAEVEPGFAAAAGVYIVVVAAEVQVAAAYMMAFDVKPVARLVHI